jgi:Glycosyl transferase family 2
VKLVMTLRARDERDVVDAQIAFHLNAGVDFIIATDHRSRDGTDEVLERYAREGYLHLIRQEGEERGDWITPMARLAASEFGADWVINSDADEFWWPRGASLREVLASVPERYGMVRALLRQFVPRPDDGSFFAERMVVRMATPAAIHDPTSLFRPNLKSIHRGDPDVTITAGGHTVVGSRFVPLRGWYPVELLHFPIRSFEQCERKYSNMASALTHSRNSYYDQVRRAFREDRFGEFYESLVVDDNALERGVRDGSVVVDTRLRDALGPLRVPATNGDASTFAPPSDESRLVFPRPSVVDDAAYAVDVAALGEAEVVRVQRRLDTFEARLAALERRPAVRLSRKLRGVATKLRGADGDMP